ncbi:MBL fold metallo-hydrolase [Parvibium lacunae]|uniref:3',5'-cyclic-nucleotide phosphodiesterase n=1 Tax=Parvibium lacunae TaxID=1888893 RepID=A0A368L2B6_9BURK|nr:3',5'-cyclic-nucleotide phosphodiesterase [Parvibium lacunae]RCS57530.1 3',5'-cyclic-nucleotide phosphodiesterase [Parvibium lacunae]
MASTHSPRRRAHTRHTAQTQIQVLGCSGGIGGPHLRTTALLVDHDVLIDAGTGVGDLSLGELSLIDHIFLTHCHLDHVVSIPLMVDSVGSMRTRPLTVHALPATIEVLKQHLFNWSIWPDFTQIPSPTNPYLIFEPLEIGDEITLNQRTFTVLPAVHTVPACGYAVRNTTSALVFSGDTGPNPALWPILNQMPDLRYLLIETAFCNREKALATLSQHLCPQLLAQELAQLTQPVRVFISHLKPGEVELTMEEVLHDAQAWAPQMLQNGMIFTL